MGTKRTPEGLIKNRIKAALNTLGPDRCWWFMPVAGEFGASGIPDFVCCVDGRFFSIEVKRGAAVKPTTRQEIRMEAIKKAKGEAIVVHAQNIERFENAIESMRTNGPSST